MQDQPRSNESVLVRVLRTYTYVAVWIFLSGVVRFNLLFLNVSPAEQKQRTD